MPTKPLDDAFDVHLQTLENNPSVAVMAAAMRYRADDCADVAGFLTAVLPSVAVRIGADDLAVVNSDEGDWSILGQIGSAGRMPKRLLAETLDAGSLQHAGGWATAPLEPRADGGHLLIAHSDLGLRRTDDLQQLAALALAMGTAVKSIGARRSCDARVRRLEAILNIANQWNRTDEMEPLLVRMAESATKLIAADRASIFLWDRHTHTLVGRPALGVEGNELRVADDAGIVGQVVRTGEPQRARQDHDQEQISRDADEQTGYRTETLLCVPLRGRDGELFGAFEMVNKLDGDFTDEDEEALVELAAHAAVALENTRQREQLFQSRRQISDEAARHIQLVGQSPVIEALRSTIRRVADTDLAILILGDNGTGKEVVAQSLHYLSGRRDQPFIAVNCAAIAETLLESELFGHEKGAFTDAHDARPGKFELADRGTLFLDEIGELSPGGQAKLLRVLDEKLVVRVGGSHPIHTDVRIIAATNQDLASMVREKRFRQDLYYRLNVVALELPPLRDRRDDVLLLAEHFLQEFCAQARRKPPKLSAEARRRLQQHPWPGNVRELRNLMERLAYLLEGNRIEADDLAFILGPSAEALAGVSASLPLAEATDRFQAEYIKHVLDRCGGGMSEAARQLGLHRSNLYRKMRQLGIEGSRNKDSAE